MIDRILNPIEEALSDSADWATIIGVGLLVLAGILTLIYVVGRARAERRMKAYSSDAPAPPPFTLQPVSPAPGPVTAEPPTALRSERPPGPVPAAPPTGPGAEPPPMTHGRLPVAPPSPFIDDPESEPQLSVDESGELDPELARLKAVLLELPFNAGRATVEENLADVARATLRYYEHAMADGSGESLPIGASDDSPTSMEGDIAAVAGYLDLEQRLGRVSPEASPHLAATLLLGALASHALGRIMLGDEDLDSSLDLAAGMVNVLMEGIGEVSLRANGEQ